jgi:hypothetical protein
VPPAAPQGSPNRVPLFIALGVVVAAAVVGLIVVLAGGDDDTAESPPSSEPATETTAQPDETSGTTAPPGDTTQPAATGVEGVELVDYGYSTYEGYDGSPSGSYAFILENTTDETKHDFGVTVAVYDKSDTVVATGSHTVYVLRPGARIGIGDEVLEDLPNGIGKIDIQLEEGFGGTTPPDGEVTVADVATQSDEFSTTTTFTVSSTYGQQLDTPYAYAVYRNEAGAIVGGAYSFVDLVPSGGKASGEVSSFDVIPGVASAEVYVDPTFF